jgi:outer membrane protein assembly factor BamB
VRNLLRPLTIFRHVAVSLALCLPSSVSAQPPVAPQSTPPVAPRPDPAVAPRQEPPVAPRPEPPVAPRPDPAIAGIATADAELESQGSHSSFKLPHQQSVIQCIDVIRQSLGRKDYFAALPLMERVLAEPGSFVPSGTASEVASHEEVRRLFRQIPADLRRRMDEQRRASAQRAWDLACSNGIVEVAAFIPQFGDLLLGVDAWWWLGSHERDHARYSLAAAAFSQLAGHPHATSDQRAVALIAAFESHLKAAQPIDAWSARMLLTKLDGQLSVGIGGRSMTLAEWLTRSSREFSGGSAIEVASVAAIDGQQQRPVQLPSWKYDLPAPLATSLAALEERQREQGVRPIPLVRPMIVGPQVIVRTLEGIHACGLATGERRWTIVNEEFRRIEERLRRFENGPFLVAATEWAQRRTQADSIFGRMSTDGRRLFAIQEPDRSGELRIDRDVPRGVVRSGPQFNKLCGYGLESGALEWEIGGVSTGKSDTYGGCFFLGSPLLLDDVLYVVAQREVELQLMAIEPEHGALRWSVGLGTASLPIEEDLLRSRVACPIVWHDGLLLCSTSAGMIVAVDPLQRVLKWGYRYPATTISTGDLMHGQHQHEGHQGHEQWWDSWREPFAGVSRATLSPTDLPRDETAWGAPLSSTLIFASPESGELHAVRLPDGEPLWSRPRVGGLMVAGIFEDLVLVLEGGAVRAHDVRTGLQRWRTITPEASGPGVLIGSVLVIPALSGGTIMLDARDGRLLFEPSNIDSPMGILAQAGRGWVALHRQSVQLLPRLADVRREVDTELERDPNSETLLVRAALLDLQAGDAGAARQRLEGLKSSPARDLRRQALIAGLQNTDVRHSDRDRAELARQLKGLADNADYKFAAAAAIGTSALAMDSLPAAVDAALDGLAANLDQHDGLIKQSAIHVRKDRMLLGMIDEAYRRAKAGERGELDTLFDSRLKEARQSRDGFAVQRIAQQWQGLDWSRRIVVLDDEKALWKRPFAEAELRLLDAVGSNDPAIGLQALEKLAQRFDRVASPLESRAVWQRILNEFPTATFPDGKTGRERIQQSQELKELVPGRPVSTWPERVPEEESRNDRNFSVYSPIIPVQAEPGSLAERLDVCVDRGGSEVLFRGESFFQSGQDEEHERKLALPRTQSPYRGQTGYMLRRGWGVGRIVVLLVGGELFAITPLDEQGEPNSRFLWGNPIDLQIPPGETKIIPGRAGTDDERHVVVDHSNRPLGKVGPVRAGYLCYQKGTKLVAVETATGRELWQRLDLPADATVLGDDHHVFVWRETKDLEILSAIDGRKVDDGVRMSSPANMIHQRGGLVWTVSRGDDVKLDLYDLRTGQLIWSRTDVAKTLTAVLDTETLAVLTPGGQLNLLAARTGIPLCPPLAVNPSAMTELVTWQDAERWYVALTQRVGNLPDLKTHQPNNAYRLRFLNGTLYGLDRHQPRILWQRELKNEPLTLDQSRVAPVLVQLWKLVPKRESAASEGMLRVIDKRTGTALVERCHVDLLPYFLLNPDREQAIVELKLPRETIRLLYAPESPADAAEAVSRAQADESRD